jgi:hypothetical protein
VNAFKAAFIAWMKAKMNPYRKDVDFMELGTKVDALALLPYVQRGGQ